MVFKKPFRAAAVCLLVLCAAAGGARAQAVIGGILKGLEPLQGLLDAEFPAFEREIASGADAFAAYAVRKPEDPAARSLFCPANLRVLAPMDAVSDWRLDMGKDPLLEETARTELPYRTAGDFELRQVRDEEKGNCLEVELAARTNLPALMSEYAVLRLKQPLAVAGEPATLGLWVKGNSGWGEVYWEIEDANGVRRLSCGTSEHGTSVFDCDGRMASINFDAMPKMTDALLRMLAQLKPVGPVPVPEK